MSETDASLFRNAAFRARHSGASTLDRMDDLGFARCVWLLFAWLAIAALTALVFGRLETARWVSVGLIPTPASNDWRAVAQRCAPHAGVDLHHALELRYLDASTPHTALGWACLAHARHGAEFTDRFITLRIDGAEHRARIVLLASVRSSMGDERHIHVVAVPLLAIRDSGVGARSLSADMRERTTTVPAVVAIEDWIRRALGARMHGRRARRRRTPLILQAESCECGIAGLAMILASHGRHVTVSELRERHGISSRGTNLRQLIEIAKSEGLRSRPLRVEFETLRDLALPALLHWQMNHFVVLTDVGRDRVHILDPARGQRSLTLAEASDAFTGVAVEFDRDHGFVPQVRGARRRPLVALRYVDRPLVKLGRIAALSLLLQSILALVPLQLQHALDGFRVQDDGAVLATVGLLFGALVGAQGLAVLMRTLSVSHTGQAMLRRWNAEVFAHVLQLPIAFFERRHLGDIISRLGVTRLVQTTLTATTVETVIDGLLALTFVVLMVNYDPSLAAFCLGMVVVLAAVRVAAFRVLSGRIEESVHRYAAQQSFLFETLRSAMTIRLIGGAQTRTASFSGLLEHSAAAEFRVMRTRAWTDASTQFLVGMERVVAIAVGAWALSRNQMTAGALVAYLAYRELFIARVVALLDKFLELGMLPVHTQRLDDIVRAPSDPTLTPASTAEPVDFGLRVTNLGFRYGSADPWILKDLSFALRPGEHVAIVGPSGCGKTTLAKLILRVLAPSNGTIELGGVPLANISEDTLRRSVAAVLQDDQLFAGSIAENIAMYTDGIDEARLHTAARQADLHEDILALPMGYETLIGDLGCALSAGQRQRLFLARALYRQPKLLITDEATSNLDVPRELRIAETIRSLKMTRLIIAHRTETIAAADRVIDLSSHRPES